MLNKEAIFAYINQLTPQKYPIALVTHTPLAIQDNQIHCVFMQNQAAAYAHDLYQTLRSLDNKHYQLIIVETPPDDTEWDAIRDRLLKASRTL